MLRITTRFTIEINEQMPGQRPFAAWRECRDLRAIRSLSDLPPAGRRRASGRDGRDPFAA
jgi:hypothetical protein